MSLIPKLGLLALLVIFLQGHDGHARPANYTSSEAANGGGFVKAGGIHFMLAGKPLFLNGFNSYWMMFMASDPSTRVKVSSVFQQAAENGMNVARTWAFSDGGNRALQKSPGSYDENVFKGLDFVVSEAKSRGVYLILSLVNNWDDFGGRKQYVQWARDRGEHLNSDDEFYINPMVKGFYKNHVKTVLTRINTITGVAYRDEPNILAWELMNEPRCQSDPSGKWIQDWVSEMAAHVKSIDSNHMLEVGLEGFYGQSNLGKPSQINPGGMLIGSDFVSNNQVPQVDFATIHVYPEQWLKNASEKVQDEFVDKWVSTHIEDSKSILQKPMMVAEFGRSSKVQGYSVEKRDSYYKKMYDSIYSSASNGGSCAGGIFWQLMDDGMSSMGDGYEVVLQDSPSTATIIAAQSHKMSAL